MFKARQLPITFHYDKYFRPPPGIHHTPATAVPHPDSPDCVGNIAHLPSNKRHRKVRISIKGANPNSSTEGLSNTWLLSFPKGESGTFNDYAASTHYHHPITGYPTNSDPHSSHILSFTSRQSAITFAKQQGWTYEAQPEPPTSRSEKHNLKKNSYALGLKHQPPPDEDIDSDFEFFHGQYHKGHTEY